MKDRMQRLVAAWDRQHRAEKTLTLDVPGTSALGAWFLGPRAENEELFTRLTAEAIADHCRDRRRYFQGDPPWITEDIKGSIEYKAAVAHLETSFRGLLEKLDGSVPFFSYRYQAHMLWDVTLPSALAYFAAMLYNQNNVAAEASPVTTRLEMQVGADLCRMIGYHVPEQEAGDPPRDVLHPAPGETIAWGHITCDGSVANMEALWAARNLKYYPLAVAAALAREESLAPARGLSVPLPEGGRGALAELDTWRLLNLRVDDVLALPTRLKTEYGIPGEAVERIERYGVQHLGLLEMHRRFAATVRTPLVLASATHHYSIPKAGALIGIGKDNVKAVPVDLDARMDIKRLRILLDRCLADRRPVLFVVAVLGTTEQSAVDPLHEVLELRDEFRARGLEFWVHADAAWGGYFASMMREPKHPPVPDPGTGAEGTPPVRELDAYPPEMHLSAYVQRQYGALPRTDSVTLDPHKAGYIPYPAGGLCYRNSAMRHLVAFTAPVVYHGGMDPTVGVYGIEGSKPGAAAAATYLSHRVIRADRSGYGKLLGRCMFNSKRFYAELVTLAEENDPFIVVPIQRLPAERRGATEQEIEEERAWIRERIVGPANDELLRDREAMDVLRELGSDQVIVAYAFNFKTGRVLNRDVRKLNRLNEAIFASLSIPQDKGRIPRTPLILTASELDPRHYAGELVGAFRGRLGVEGEEDTPIDFLISTTMDPWLTDTAEGSFIPTIMDVLRTTVLNVIGSDQEFR